MLRSFRLRAGLVLSLALVVVSPVTVLGAAPVGAPPPTAHDAPASPVGDLLAAADSAIDALGAAIGDAADTVTAAVDLAAGPCSGYGGLDYGKDGRLTILLLGSDYRSKRYIGERMDVIIVATRKANGRIAMASIPRDTAYFPKAGGGNSGYNRVNTMYYTYKRHKRNYERVDCAALDHLRRDVATALRTEIDYYAMVRMNTFVALVDNIGYVLTDIPGAIDDPTYGRHGAYFPKKQDYRLVGNAGCRRKPRECHSGLAYVRSRHGTQGSSANNDFKRSFRQHTFIFDTAMRVRARGNGAALTDLMRSITDKVWTDVPKNLTVGRAVHSLLGGISMAGVDRAVLGPTTFARSLSSPAYAYRLRLTKVRAWINDHFGS